jgi:cytochrome c-type biogenesis protein CcmE
MNKKSIGIISIAVVLVGVGFGLHWLLSKESVDKARQATVSKVAVVDVDEIASQPERFSGTIGVEGPVTDVDEAKSIFALGCEDACIAIPVEYRGRLPKKGTNVIAYGKIKKTPEAKFVFVAHEIEAK